MYYRGLKLMIEVLCQNDPYRYVKMPDLLENGPKQLSQAWVLGALYNEWKKIKGYDKLDPKENEGQLQSSMKEWEESVKKYQN